MNVIQKKRLLSDLIVQIDIGSAQPVSSPKYLVCALQSRPKTDIYNKNNNIAIFDNLDLRKYHVGIDSIRVPRDPNHIDNDKKEYIAQWKDLIKNFKEYIGEPIFNPFVSNSDMNSN